MKQKVDIRPKIAHFGAFDHDSYGDLIFPLIVEHFLPNFAFTHVSPTGKKTPWPDALRTISVAEAFALDDWDGVLIGGGDIIQSGEWATQNWAQTPLLSMGALPSLWCGASLLAAKLNVPCVWNCPGVPRDIPPHISSLATEALRSVDYLCLRDSLSAERLNKLLTRSASVVPDTAAGVCELWQAIRVKNIGKAKPLVLSLMPRDVSERWHEIEELLASVGTRSSFSGEVVILPLMGWQSDTGLLPQNLRSKSGVTLVIRDRSLSLEKCALEIANSLAYVGNSLHGLITAVSYGVPGVLVKPLGCELNTKYIGFAEHYSPDDTRLVANSFIEAAEIIATGVVVTNKNASIQLRNHWRRVEDVLLRKPEINKSKYWQGIYNVTCQENVKMLMHGISAQTLMTGNVERDGQIASLNQTVVERDGQIASLNQTVVERDGQIASLNQTLAERDRQIASLTNETVRRGEWAIRLDQELKEAQAKVIQITSSNSWRFTLLLREGRRWLTDPSSQAKRYLSRVAKFGKTIYTRLPLSHQTKTAHRLFLAKHVPWALHLSNGQTISVPIMRMPMSTAQPITDLGAVASGIKLATSLRPVVSVIIPIYGKCDYTLRCLASIAANSPSTPFEVIVVNDCSPDNSAEVLQGVDGIRSISNSVNQGFIRSCNVGAKSASGEYLYFLNNDTEVTPGWLDELIRTFREFPGTGLAGSKLVYPNGTLQEAGGIIWQDGSAWNFGRNQDPSLPIYNYAREVDYCSGASIMVPKALFEELDGFDEHYLPAYCEDSDLALKIRDIGFRVIYQPLSTVIHYEGITSGTDTSQGAKAYQTENSKKLYERWKNRLQIHQPAGMDADNAKDRRAIRRVLVIDHCTPTPNQDAGSVTVFNLMLLLREMDFQVTFIPEDNYLYMSEYTTSLQRAGIEVLYAPYTTNVKQHLKDCGNRYDLALLFRPAVVERQIKTIRKHCPKAKVLFHTVDLHFLRMSREAELQSDRAKQKAADEMKQRELAAIRASDASIVHSTAELEFLRPELPDAKIHVFPLIMDIRGTSKTFAERRDIVFVGGYQHTPNVDAVQYFVSAIMPLLRQRLQGVRFYAVGSKPPAEIQALASEDVIILGFVEDLTLLLDKMRVSVAPLRYGAGIKGKIGSAMAVGLPVVVTPLAAEGMSLTDGENILVAEGAEQFVDAIVSLYQDEALWNRIGHNGLEFAENAWGAEAAWRILAGILSELSLNSVQNTRPLTLYTPTTTNASVTQNGKSNLTDSVIDDDYQKKIQQELAIYEKQVNVHDLPEIYHYWSNKHLVPIFQEAGFKTIDEFFSQNLLGAQSLTKSSIPRFVSIGSGNCDLEVAIAKSMLQRGCRNFVFECVELNPVMLDRGKKIAEQNGVLEFMRFVKSDFNTWTPTAIYDGVMANQSLHHVTELEHLLGEVKKALHHKGAFVISDMIGRNGHQRWPESLDSVNRFWKELPNNYKYNVLLHRHEEEYENWDCSKEGFEGIRAQDILPLLVKMFHCDRFIGFGSAIDIFVDRCFGHNFNPSGQWDMNFIDRVHQADEEGLRSGKLTPTHMLAVMVKYPVTDPYYSRDLSPYLCVRQPNE